jgi:UDP-glucose 4-epimerase
MTREDTRDISVLLVGASSLLGSALLSQQHTGICVRGISHTQFHDVDAHAYDVVINMAYNPLYMREAYDPALDFDRRVAQEVARGSGHFIMMSTRRVYGPARQTPVPEDAPTEPTDTYGHNKLKTEGEIRALLGNRCTILRLANVFGFEPGRHTFFGIALDNLHRHGRIILDVNPFVKKDFIPLPDCAEAILSLIVARPAGTFNLGYGTATEIGRIAMWLIEGFGRGELMVTSAEERDSFLLDISRLKALAVLPQYRISIRERCVEIGELLRNA